PGHGDGPGKRLPGAVTTPATYRSTSKRISKVSSTISSVSPSTTASASSNTSSGSTASSFSAIPHSDVSEIAAAAPTPLPSGRTIAPATPTGTGTGLGSPAAREHVTDRRHMLVVLLRQPAHRRPRTPCHPHRAYIPGHERHQTRSQPVGVPPHLP